MLSVVDAGGVPSVSRWVRIGSEGQVAAARVQSFADELKASEPSESGPATSAPGTSAPAQESAHRHHGVKMAEGYDGCDHAYGEISQCVPWSFPKMPRAERCTWLLDKGYGRMKVHGRDRHHLDRDKDGIACGKGDVRRS